jgi:hypothetical protein
MSRGSIRKIKATKRVADAVIRKIIYYISLFSEEVRVQLLGKTSNLIQAVVEED